MSYADDVAAWRQLGTAASPEQRAAVQAADIQLGQQQSAQQEASQQQVMAQQQLQSLQQQGLYNPTAGNVQPGQVVQFRAQIEQQKAAAATNLEAAQNAYNKMLTEGRYIWSDPQYQFAKNQYDVAKQNYEQTMKDSISQYNALTGAVPTSSGGGGKATGKSSTFGDLPSPYQGGAPGASGGLSTAYIKSVTDPETGRFLPTVPGAAALNTQRFVDITRETLPYREDYTQPGTLGDLQTQRIAQQARLGLSVFNVGMGEAGFEANAESLYGSILGQQMRGAQERGGYRETQFYGGELQKVAENLVAIPSQYHFIGKVANQPIPANPFEYQGDLAVEFLKGAPTKPSEVFSPVSGQMAPFLPGGQGLQQYQWNMAVAYDRNLPVSYEANFTPALNRLMAARGDYGPYGTLFGGPGYIGTPSSNGLQVQPSIPIAPSVIAGIRADVLKEYGVVEPIGGLPAPFVSTPKNALSYDPFTPIAMAATEGSSGSSGRLVGGGMVASQPSISTIPAAERQTYFQELSNWISGAPILGEVYRYGQGTPSEEVIGIREFLQNAPILGSIYQGGNVFELKSDYEKAATSIQPVISPLITKYQSDLAKYEGDLSKYSEMVSKYNANPTESGYKTVISEQMKLQQQKSTLDAQRSTIDSKMAPVISAETAYNRAAGALVGNVNQKELATYGIGSFIGNIGKGYSDIVVTPFENATKPTGAVGEFLTGLVGTPSMIATIGESALIGGETIARNLPSFPGVATAGLAMQAKGTYEQSQINPAGLLGTIVGIAIVTGGVRAIGGRVVGIARTSGMEYVPVENIGYDVNRGFAIGNPNEAGLIRSFQEGTLSPRPTQMSLSEEVPYIPGEAGRPYARLPSTPSGEYVLWTGHESNILTRGVNVGEAVHLTTPGTSEVSGVYGASVLMSYFTKAGGQIPKMIGFDTPFKSPTVYSTTVADIESIPRGISRQAIAGDYGPMNQYIQAQATARPGGQAFLPLAKAEYEAVIPTGSVIEVTGRNYYTRLGGFGQSHFLGTRVPIVEQSVIGFEPIDITPVGVRGVSSDASYIRPSPVISITNLYAGVSSNPVAVSKILSGSEYGVSDKTLPIEKMAYRYSGTGVSERVSNSRLSQTSPLYKTSYTPPTTEPLATRLSEGLSYPESPMYDSSLISSSYKIGSPGYPVYGYPTTATPPPTSPSGGFAPPTPPITPIPPISGFPYLGSGGSGQKPPRRRKRKVELFSFEMAEDTPIPTRYGLGGKTVFYIPGSRGIAADILPRGDIAPNRLFNILGSKTGDHL